MRLFDEYIRWPEEAECQNLAAQFRKASKSKMPLVGGCIDGTHIKIATPKENEPFFVNRKQEHSLNCMFVCGPDCKYYAMSSKWPGSVADSRVLQKSALAEKLNSGWRPFPGAVLLGDSGYANSDWLITHLAVPQD